MRATFLLQVMIAALILGAGAGQAFADKLDDAASAYERKDYTRAFGLWKPLAHQGNADAQYNLGTMYEDGLGVPRDSVQAHMWFSLAGAGGHAAAIKSRDVTAKGMTVAQVAEARRLAREWRDSKVIAENQSTEKGRLLGTVFSDCPDCPETEVSPKGRAMKGGDAAKCTGLLWVDGDGRENAQPITLSDCDISSRFEGSGRTARVILRLKEPAASAWRAALDPKGGLASALLEGKLTLRSHAGGLPKAPLLSSNSTGGAANNAWFWDASSASLSIDPKDSALGAAGARCPMWHGGGPLLWLDALEVQPGTLITPSAYWSTRPGSYDRIDPACLSGWTISEGAHAVLHSGLGLVITAPDAPEGAEFQISARIAGQSQESTVRGFVRVTDPGLHPLAGNWTEVQEKSCSGGAWRKPATPIGELVFKAGGTFTLTRSPFERYLDYWGTYRHVAASGALALEITGGNTIPSNHSATGRARIMPSGVLLMEDLPPWNAETDAATCWHLFRRQ
jgi:hypothetical protein